MTEDLVVALNDVTGRDGPAAGLVVHTDRGSQYTSRKFEGELARNGFIQSFSRKGCPYDNAVMESFFRALKRELPLDGKYESRIDARGEIFKLIELYYNTTRPHSSLGNLSPVEYERENC